MADVNVIGTTHNYRVATNLENLEYSAISLNLKKSGNSAQPQRKIVTKYFSSSLKYLVTEWW